MLLRCSASFRGSPWWGRGGWKPPAEGQLSIVLSSSLFWFLRQGLVCDPGWSWASEITCFSASAPEQQGLACFTMGVFHMFYLLSRRSHVWPLGSILTKGHDKKVNWQCVTWLFLTVEKQVQTNLAWLLSPSGLGSEVEICTAEAPCSLYADHGVRYWNGVFWPLAPGQN